ncbi:MAG: o-succinylbenzoate--CoA ligase [Anaerolineales bacterium]
MDYLARRAIEIPRAPAVQFKGKTWNYLALHQWADFLAHDLEKKGVHRGARVAIYLSNQPAYIALIHALARIGAIAAPLNLRLTAPELEWQIEQSDSRFLLVHKDHEGETLKAKHSANILYLPGEPPPQNAAVLIKETALDAQSPQGIFFTSGTTGFPKGAVLSLENYYASAMASAQRLPMQANDLWLLALPLYHIGGMSIVFRAAIYGVAILLHAQFDVEETLRALTEENVTHVSLVPTMLRRLLHQRPNFQPSPALRVILLGGANCPPDLLQQALDLNLPIALTYGLTEACSQVATSTPEETRRKPGSVGAPLPGTTVSIEDEFGRALPAGHVGEIVVRGKTVMSGYLHQSGTDSPEGERALRTGDLGYKDEDGDLWTLARRSDLIVSGGENVYPQEVEQALARHPAVAECCVFGVKHPEWGQAVIAAVIQKTPCQEGELLRFLRSRLAGYKIPKQILFLQEFPRTASGKIKRNELAKAYQQARKT